MLTKLIFKNVGKSMQDYTVYFLTLVFGVSVFYMFNSIYAQQEVMAITDMLHDSMVALRKILSVISVFVAVVLGFLIIYANNFFIRRRKKEIGIYMTLGLSRGKISAILVFETFFMGLFALLTGLITGILGSQFMSVFTAKIFEVDMSDYKFIFSPDAALKSIICFAVIFLTAILFNTIGVSRYQLIDLLYGGRKNESLKFRNNRFSVILFFLSVILLGIAYFLVLKNGILHVNSFFIYSIILGTAGTFLFFFSLSGWLTNMVQSNKRLYYKNLNIFVTRQLTSTINTNFITISVVSIVLFLVIGIFSSGYSMKNMMSADLKESAPYDVSFYGQGDHGSIYESLPVSIKKADTLNYEFYTYHSKNKIQFMDFPIDYSSLSFDIGKRTPDFILLSDYKSLLEMTGYKTDDLSQGEYFILATGDSFVDVARQFLDKQVSISLGDKTLLPKGKVKNIKVSNMDSGIRFVVNDTLADTFNKAPDKVLNMTCKNEEAASVLKEGLSQYKSSSEYEDRNFLYYLSKDEVYSSSVGIKAVVSFLAIYLGMVFMIACAAILAIQQLAQAADNKERFELLRKLGVERKMLEKALFVQILCYFLFPLLLAVIHSVVGLTVANTVMKTLGHVRMTDTVMVPALFIIVIYGAYFVLTYAGGKNILKRS